MKKVIETTQEATNLFSLSKNPKELKIINNLIEQQKGMIVTLIHPFFWQMVLGLSHLSPAEAIEQIKSNDLNELVRIGKYYSNSKKYSDRNIINDSNVVTEISAKSYYHRLHNFLIHQNTRLILLGEDIKYLDASVLFLKEFGYKGHILYYKTGNGEPKPHETVGTWDTFADALFALNFERLVVGGQLCGYDKNAADPSKPTGCVPEFIRKVSQRKPKHKKVEFIISPITYSKWWIKNDKHPYFRSRISAQ